MLALFRADFDVDELVFFKASLGELSPTFLRQLKRDIIAEKKRRRGVVRVTLRLTVGQSVLVSRPFWDSSPDYEFSTKTAAVSVLMGGGRPL
jgi:hypothetical protein